MGHSLTYQEESSQNTLPFQVSLLGDNSGTLSQDEPAQHATPFQEVSATRFIVTGEGNLVSNIKLAINHYFTFIRPYALIGPDTDVRKAHYDDYES